MASVSSRGTASKKFSLLTGSTSLFQIVALACLAGLVMDVLVAAFPPAFGSAEWRLNLLLQISNRGILLVLGFAFLMYAAPHRRSLKKLAMTCFTLGLILLISSGLAAQDTLTLKSQVEQRVKAQSSQLEAQLSQLQSSQKAMSPEQVEKASRSIAERAESTTRNAHTSMIKSGTAVFGNLVITGLALIGLGRCSQFLGRD